MTQPGAAGVITRRADPIHTRRDELRRDRGIACAWYDRARRVADRSAISDREPLAVAISLAERLVDGVGVPTGLVIRARIRVRFRIADGFGERHVQRVGLAEPARFSDSFGLAGRDSYAGAERACLDPTGQS